MAFRVGQKVVCVDTDGFGGTSWLWTYPAKGAVYTIRELTTWSDGTPSLRLSEIKNRVRHSQDGSMYCEPMFAARRFRPIVEKKTDIGFAHEILRKTSKRETLPA